MTDKPPLDANLLKSCKDSWGEEFIAGVTNSNNCSGFVKAVASKMHATLPAQQADGLITYMKDKWTTVASGTAARTLASTGVLVVGGLKSSEQKKKPPEGHVVVVVDGPLYHDKYPMCWCGSTGMAQSEGTKSVGEVFAVSDRDKVAYFTPNAVAAV